MMIWKEFGRNGRGVIRHYPDIFLEGLRKTIKASVISGLQAEI
jgi:hypothetical protein